jgi:hypothetical protein
MAIDLSSLRKLESLPPSLQSRGRAEGERVLVLVKLKGGRERPSYVKLRSQVSSEIISGELASGDLVRLEHDPDVESFSVSRALAAIE